MKYNYKNKSTLQWLFLLLLAVMRIPAIADDNPNQMEVTINIDNLFHLDIITFTKMGLPSLPIATHHAGDADGITVALNVIQCFRFCGENKIIAVLQEDDFPLPLTFISQKAYPFKPGSHITLAFPNDFEAIGFA